MGSYHFHQNLHENDIILSYDIKHKQIIVYKQSVVSQLPDLNSQS